ncbi:LysR family transcriptional regulator [Sporomusa sp.]|uniref:LysR family transcriptional regulator n=1 Tax=Sporomusa sp. TaxID=2078658 RepID=UPI002CC1310F|nr:LysR substrate-binding domain-containing protein [Sporomusa sp.]HWR45507.1 LysR substrate-binding domain-containing protein [Sporomusa sp.]
MEIRQLRYFIAVAQSLSFTEAAKRLYITQPSLSQQIAALEKDIGVKLFIRNKQGVQLTSAGSAFLLEATDIVHRSEEAVKIAKQASCGIIGKLRVGFLGPVQGHFLAKLLACFRRKHPGIELTFIRLSVGGIDQALLENNLDIGFSVLTDIDDLPAFSWKKISTDIVSLVMPSDHPLSFDKNIDTALLARHPFVFSDRESATRVYNNLQRVCKNRGFAPNIVSTSPYIESVMLSIETGMGLSVYPRYAVENYASPLLHIVEFAGEDAFVDTVAIWKRTNTNPAISMLLEELELQKSEP